MSSPVAWWEIHCIFHVYILTIVYSIQIASAADAPAHAAAIRIRGNAKTLNNLHSRFSRIVVRLSLSLSYPLSVSAVGKFALEHAALAVCYCI